MSGNRVGDELVEDETAPVGLGVPRSRSARRQVRSWVRYRFKGWAPWLGYLYLALALAGAIDEPLTLGVIGLVLGVPITWVCGLWVLPRNEDAYALATSKVLHDWEVEIKRIQLRHSSESRRLATATLDRLPESLPPGSRERLSNALVRKPEDAAPTPEMVRVRIISSYLQRMALKAALQQIETECHHCAPAIHAAVTSLLDARRAANHEFLAALAEERACLAKIASPRALSGAHSAFVQLCQEYRDAIAASYDAIEAEQEEAVRRSADRVCSIWQARRNSMRNVLSIIQGAPGLGPD